MSTSKDQGRMYRTECTGAAHVTVLEHQRREDVTLFGSCFCPFVQRVWMAFEELGLPYTLDEVDPYQKPKELLEVSAKGLVPALRMESFRPPRALNESTVIMEYLEDLAKTVTKRSLLPSTDDPYARALLRLQADHVNRTLIPAFYRYLQAQDAEKQIEAGKEFHESIEGLVKLLERAEQDVLGGEGAGGDETKEALARGLGLWVRDGELGWTDVMVAPWLYRAKVVLTHYRGFEMPKGKKFEAWIEKLFSHPAFSRTCSTDQLYLDSYERYAFNRPNTSQVADAINSGQALP